MKRLFKMLSLLSILLILGSCDSSKAINIEAVLGNTRFVVFDNYVLNTHKIVGIQITGGGYSGKTVYIGDQIEIALNTSYDITWIWIEGVNQKSGTKLGHKFNSDYGTQTIYIGTGDYSSIFY